MLIGCSSLLVHPGHLYFQQNISDPTACNEGAIHPPLTLPCQSKHAGCWGNASLSVPNLQDAPAAWVRNKATLCSHQREIPCQSSMASPFLSPTPMLAPVHLEVARVCKSWTKAVAHQPVLLGIVPANLRFGGNTEDGVCSWNA